MIQLSEFSFFTNFTFFTIFTIAELYTSSCSEVSTENGIYAVIAPEDFEVRFTDTTTALAWFRGKSLLYPKELLVQKYSALQQNRLLYIGKAQRKKGLQKRILEYVKYGFGETNNHRGGRAIWQIKNAEKLMLGYRVTPTPESMETKLLLQYKSKFGEYPPSKLAKLALAVKL